MDWIRVAQDELLMNTNEYSSSVKDLGFRDWMTDSHCMNSCNISFYASSVQSIKKKFFYDFGTKHLYYDINRMRITPRCANINFAMTAADCLVCIVNLSRRYSAWMIQLHGERHEFAFCHVNFWSVSLNLLSLIRSLTRQCSEYWKREFIADRACIFEWKQEFSTSFLQLPVKKNIYIFISISAFFNIGILWLPSREIGYADVSCQMLESNDFLSVRNAWNVSELSSGWIIFRFMKTVNPFHNILDINKYKTSKKIWLPPRSF